MVFPAKVLDYTTDEAGPLVDGSGTEPVTFEEFWTFVRLVGRVRGASPPSGNLNEASRPGATSCLGGISFSLACASPTIWRELSGPFRRRLPEH